jgi:hypothetical protein
MAVMNVVSLPSHSQLEQRSEGKLPPVPLLLVPRFAAELWPILPRHFALVCPVNENQGEIERGDDGRDPGATAQFFNLKHRAYWPGHMVQWNAHSLTADGFSSVHSPQGPTPPAIDLTQGHSRGLANDIHDPAPRDIHAKDERELTAREPVRV